MTTRANPVHPVVSNVLDRRFQASKPNERWVTDISYVWTDEGWCYLAVILDLFSRAVLASFVIVIVPVAIVANIGFKNVAMAVAALGTIALSAIGFAVAQPIRHAPLTPTRWLCQGSAAAAASALAWVIVNVAARW